MICVGHCVPLSDPENEVTKGCNREQDWKSEAIEHCHITSIQQQRVLVMDNVCWARVKVQILVNLGSFSTVQSLNFVLLPSLVKSLEEPHLNNWNKFKDRWQD